MTGKRDSVLFLAHRIPYPPDKGDKIRAFHLLKYLAQRFDVTLGCFVDDPDDLVHQPALDTMCVQTKYISIAPLAAKVRSLKGLLRREPLSFSFYQNAEMSKFITQSRQALGGFAAEIAYSSQVAPYLKGAVGATFVDLVDVDSAKFSAYAEDGGILGRLVYGREGRLLAQAEAQVILSATKSFFVTPEEASLARQHPGVASEKVDWYRNGVDTSYWRADARFDRIAPGFDIVLTGAVDYRPNVEAACDFVTTIWPVIRTRHPHLTFGIVGARPTQEVQRLATHAGVTVTGKVPDIRPYLAAAKVAVAPLKIARGVQNKVLEAMAMATPVVASTGAFTGTGATVGSHVLVADTAHEVADAIDTLLTDPARALALGESAAAFIRREYPWDRTLGRFDAALSRHLGTRDAAA